MFSIGQKRRIALVGALFLAGALLFPAGCESDSSDKGPDLEEQQWQYLLLSMQGRSVHGTCVTAATSAIDCANTAGGASLATYIAILQAAYTITIAAPQGATEVCNALTASANFPVPNSNLIYSDGIKICFLNCETTYWTNSKNAGICTAANFSKLIPSSDPTYQNCAKACFAQGTILPP